MVSIVDMDDTIESLEVTILQTLVVELPNIVERKGHT